MLNRVEFRSVCGRRDPDDDGLFGDGDVAWCGEEVGEELLRLPRLTKF